MNNTMFTGKAGVDTYRAIAIKHGLKLFMDTGMRPNRMWTPTAMLMAAGAITGKTFKRGQYAEAIYSLEAWLIANGTTGESNENQG